MATKRPTGLTPNAELQGPVNFIANVPSSTVAGALKASEQQVNEANKAQ